MLTSDIFEYEMAHVRRFGSFPTMFRVQHWVKLNTWNPTGVIPPWSERKDYTGGHRLMAVRRYGLVRRIANAAPFLVLLGIAIGGIVGGTALACVGLVELLLR